MIVWKIILGIMVAIVAIALVVGIVAFVIDLFTKSSHKPYGPYERYLKRPLDAFLATGALLVLSPVVLITAIMVRIKLGSPVLFKQDRPGKDGKVFKLIKFRTMTEEKDENGKLLPGNARLTPFGRKLRLSSLDELPELINIVKGDMSIVGPRPLLVSYLDNYNEYEKRRHSVRPGLTGLAQIRGRNQASWEERFSNDVEYAENVSFLNDLKIIYKTVEKVVKHEGVEYQEDCELIEDYFARHNDLSDLKG